MFVMKFLKSHSMGASDGTCYSCGDPWNGSGAVCLKCQLNGN